MYYLHTPRLVGIINDCNTVSISCKYKIHWIFISTWDLWFFTVIINLLWQICVKLIIYITIVLISYFSEQTGSYRLRFCFRSTYVETMKEWSAYFGLLPRINAYLFQLASSSIHWYGLQGLQKFWLDIATLEHLSIGLLLKLLIDFEKEKSVTWIFLQLKKKVELDGFKNVLIFIYNWRFVSLGIRLLYPHRDVKKKLYMELTHYTR